MKFLQKLGKALMLPVAVLPICGILMGIGYWLCPATMQGGDIQGAANLIGLFLVKAGAALILLLWREYQKKQTHELNLCLKAFAVLGIAGIIAIILYRVFSIYWYVVIFQFGIFLYITFLFGGLLCKVSNEIQFHLEQTVFERMSVEDRMTGLKNRKAFEKCMEEVQEDAILLKNALLLFIHIDGLKEINDMNGMQMGDEAVIRIARSI